MRSIAIKIGGVFGALALLAFAVPAYADALSGYGQLSGKVTGAELGILPVVFAFKTTRMLPIPHLS